MPAEFWAALGTLGTGVLAYLGVRYTARQSKVAQNQATEAEEKAVDAAAYDRARTSYEAAIASYEKQARVDSERMNECNTRIADLTREILDMSNTHREQRRVIEVTVQRLEEAREMHRTHMKFCEERQRNLRERIEHNEPIHEDDLELRMV